MSTEVPRLEPVTTRTPATYSYDQVAERIEQVLGEQPSKSALRAAPLRQRRTRGRRPGLTAGMPAPLPSPSKTIRARFSAAAIEEWLALHPRLEWARAIRDAKADLAAGQPTEDVVSAAFARGLSWRQITAILNDHDGGHRSVSGVHKRYRRLEEGQP